MLIENLMRKSLVALCVLGLAACSTTPDSTPSDNTTAPPEETQPVVETATQPPISLDEQMRMESEQKRQERTFYFEFDESTVKQQYLPVLELHAKFLIKSGVTITLEGHADERGTQAYNLALGERRAKAVATYLMNYGLSQTQINVVSYGEEQPADSGHNEGSWEMNRRVELVYR